MTKWQRHGFRLRGFYLLLWVMLLIVAGVVAWRPIGLDGWSDVTAARVIEEGMGFIFFDHQPPIAEHGLDGVFGLFSGSRYSFHRSLMPYILLPAAATLTLLVATLFYLLPTRSTSKLLPAMRRPTWLSLATLTFMLSLLLTGVVWAVLDYLFQVEEILDPLVGQPTHRIGVPEGFFHNHYGYASNIYLAWWSFPLFAGCIFILAFLACGTMVLLRNRGQRQRYWQHERDTRMVLLLGLGVALACVVLVEVANAYSDWTYFDWEDSGTYTAVLIGLFVALWAFGCRVVLLLMLGRYERAAENLDEPICFACGYDLRGTLGHGHACPECGQPIPARLG